MSKDLPIRFLATTIMFPRHVCLSCVHNCCDDQSCHYTSVNFKLSPQRNNRARLRASTHGSNRPRPVFLRLDGENILIRPKRQTATQRTTDKQQRPVYIIITGLFKTHQLVFTLNLNDKRVCKATNSREDERIIIRHKTK